MLRSLTRECGHTCLVQKRTLFFADDQVVYFFIYQVVYLVDTLSKPQLKAVWGVRMLSNVQSHSPMGNSSGDCRGTSVKCDDAIGVEGYHLLQNNKTVSLKLQSPIVTIKAI